MLSSRASIRSADVSTPRRWACRARRGWIVAERDREEDPDLAIRLLRIQKGATVADVGAGSGNITIRLAKAVGPMGKVYANDIQPGMLEILQKNVGKAKLTNVVPVLGAIDDPKLPAESIDLAIMVDVYHEFSEPQKMLQRLREAIKPGGRLVLLEYRAEDPEVPILREHKMTKAQVKLEVEHEGFKQSRVFDDLPWQHLFVFTQTLTTNPRIDVPPVLVRQIGGRRRRQHDHGGERLCLRAFEIARPFLVVVDTDRQADRAVGVLREVRKAAAGIHDVAVVAEMVLAGLRAALVGNRARADSTSGRRGRSRRTWRCRRRSGDRSPARST